jgi:hypothetical protein
MAVICWNEYNSQVLKQHPSHESGCQSFGVCGACTGKQYITAHVLNSQHTSSYQYWTFKIKNMSTDSMDVCSKVGLSGWHSWDHRFESRSKQCLICIMPLDSWLELTFTWIIRPNYLLLPRRSLHIHTEFFSGKRRNFPWGLQKVLESPDIFYERSYPTNVTTNVPSLLTLIFTEFRRTKAPFWPENKSITIF